MATTWIPMPELKDLVDMLKVSHEETLHHIQSDRILYASFSQKKSNVLGRIGPIPPRFTPFLKDYDYFLEIHKENWLEASEGKKLYIILHELYHIPVEGFNTESKQYKNIVKHDLEDFKDLVKEYGVDMEGADKLVEMVTPEQSDLESGEEMVD